MASLGAMRPQAEHQPSLEPSFGDALKKVLEFLTKKADRKASRVHDSACALSSTCHYQLGANRLGSFIVCSLSFVLGLAREYFQWN